MPAPSRPRTLGKIPDPLWEAVAARAAERGETVTLVARRAFEEYIKLRPGEKPLPTDPEE